MVNVIKSNRNVSGTLKTYQFRSSNDELRVRRVSTTVTNYPYYFGVQMARSNQFYTSTAYKNNKKYNDNLLIF